MVVPLNNLVPFGMNVPSQYKSRLNQCLSIVRIVSGGPQIAEGGGHEDHSVAARQ
jgi:hypothetical protein